MWKWSSNILKRCSTLLVIKEMQDAISRLSGWWRPSPGSSPGQGPRGARAPRMAGVSGSITRASILHPTQPASRNQPEDALGHAWGMIPAAPPVVAKLGSSLTLTRNTCGRRTTGAYMPMSQPLDPANVTPHVAKGPCRWGYVKDVEM